jgi:hypothetical protein
MRAGDVMARMFDGFLIHLKKMQGSKYKKEGYVLEMTNNMH